MELPRTPLRLHLVIPCFNEASRLDPEAFLRFIASDQDAALIFVNDGSTDSTGAVLEALARQAPARAAVLTLPENLGKAAAVRRGVLTALQSGAAFVGYWDADLSTPLTAVPDFLKVLQEDGGIDVVMGARVQLLGRQIRRKAARHYSGRIFATAASLVLGLAVYDTQCGAKIFRVTERLKHAFREPFISTWAFDVELLARYRFPGGSAARLYEIPLDRWTDVTGSKLKLRHAIGAGWDLLRLWRRYRAPRRASKAARIAAHRAE